ncbi:hypothetical protein QBC43DRAFT_79298 [Cladorrhinum sp. PSN259]|nr:hypothetical protein QBC43DRAFT_79298 [Cladorrhinum sp. PSN259]
MRSVFSCSSCAVLLLSGLVGQEVSASHVGREMKDVVHRIPKAQVTAGPLLRRDGDEPTCATDFHACPSSLGGNCCPSRYACAVDSCYATTAGPVTGCASAGFYPCGTAQGGGCCQVGYICASNDCIPPAGVTSFVKSCPQNYFLCPSSLNYGCCPNGRGCAINQCYATEPVTATVTQVITATSAGETFTATTTATRTSTPAPPTGVAPGDERAAKFMPTSVPKVPASTPSSKSKGGGSLSGAAIGGIVAGVVVLLIVVIVAAYLIIRHLNRVVEVVESKKESTAKSRSQALREEWGQHLHPGSPDYADSRSNDHLMTGTSNPNSAAVTPQPGGAVDARGRSDSNPAGGFTPSPNLYDRYNISPEVNQGYFDNIASNVQPPLQAARIRSSTESSGQGYPYAYTHYRQQSNASELSDGSDRGVNSPLVQELDSTGYAELPSGASRMRSRSSSTGHMRQRSDSTTIGGAFGNGQAPGLGLTPLDESAEQPEIHGFYGRSNQQSGQTAAGLEVGWDMSSPAGMGPMDGELPPVNHHQGLSSGYQQQPGGYSQGGYQTPQQQGGYQDQGGYQHQHHNPDDIERPPPPPPK